MPHDFSHDEKPAFAQIYTAGRDDRRRLLTPIYHLPRRREFHDDPIFEHLLCSYPISGFYVTYMIFEVSPMQVLAKRYLSPIYVSYFTLSAFPLAEEAGVTPLG